MTKELDLKRCAAIRPLHRERGSFLEDRGRLLQPRAFRHFDSRVPETEIACVPKPGCHPAQLSISQVLNRAWSSQTIASQDRVARAPLRQETKQQNDQH